MPNKLKNLRRKAIKIQNAAYPRRVSMSEALQQAKKEMQDETRKI